MDRKIFKYLIPIYLVWFIVHIILFFTFMFSSMVSGYFDPFYFVLLIISHLSVIGIGLAFMIYMIVDCAKRKFKADSDRVLWILVMIFLSVFGAIVYYYVHGKDPLEKQGKKK